MAPGELLATVASAKQKMKVSRSARGTDASSTCLIEGPEASMHTLHWGFSGTSTLPFVWGLPTAGYPQTFSVIWEKSSREPTY